MKHLPLLIFILCTLALAALGGAAQVARLHDSGGIHFTEEGSEKLATAVTAIVSHYLPAEATDAGRK